MWRTRIAIAATSALIATGLVACGGSTEAADQQSLTILTGWNQGTPEAVILAKVVDSLKQQGITVNVTEAGETIPDVYETSLAGGNEADVVVVNLAEKTNNWVKDGAAVSAQQYIDEWDLADKIKPEALKAWADADGKAQGFPYAGFVWPVWYNTALLKQAGVDSIPTTTDELVAAATKLRAAGIPPMAIGGSDWSGQKLFLQIIQSFMTPEETTKVFTEGGYCANPNALKGIELFTSLRDAGVFIDDAEGYSADQMNATFYDGKAAIMPAGSWAFADAPASLISTVTLSGLPVPAGGDFQKPTAYEGYTGSGFWISNNGVKKIDAVRKFVTAFYDPAVVASFATEANTPTAAVSGSDVQITQPLMKAAVSLGDSVDFAVMPDTVVPGALADPMIRETSIAFAQGSDANAICGSLDTLYGA